MDNFHFVTSVRFFFEIFVLFGVDIITELLQSLLLLPNRCNSLRIVITPFNFGEAAFFPPKKFLPLEEGVIFTHVPSCQAFSSSSSISNYNAYSQQDTNKRRYANNAIEMAKKVGRLILVRHGESIWNSCDPARGMTTRFTGWCNIPLSDRGKEQAKAAARALVQFNLHTFDSVYMSVLERTTMTYDLIREEIFKMQKKYADGPAKFFKDPTINQSWRLNERHYGALVGLSKEEAEHSMGREPVMGWRRSWDQRPPPMTRHPYFQSLGTDTKPRFDWQTGMFASFLVLIVYCLIHLHLHLHSPFLFHLFMSSHQIYGQKPSTSP